MKRAVLPLLATLALIILGVWLVWTQGIAPGIPLHFDEAAHALLGLQAAEHASSGDWLGLVFDSYSQTLWPPLHAWVTGLVFLSFGASPAGARAVSVAC